MNRILVFFLAASVLSAVSAADLYAPAGTVTTNFVADGASVTHEGRLATSSEGRLVKTGTGTWTVSAASVAQHWPLALSVQNGTVRLPSGGTMPENTAPDVLQEALLWVSAKDADATHLAKEGDKVSAWYDVRETDVADRRHYCAKVTNGTDLATLTEKDGVKSVYFGGVGSKVAMHFFAPGATAYSSVSAKHLFAVVGVYKSQGCVFGSGSSSGNLFMANITKTTGEVYADLQRLWPSTQRGRTYVDGVRCDPYQDAPPVGRFHLFDTSSQIVPVDAKTGAFFAQWGDVATKWGGDYLAEAIVFTNQLSETERVAVQSYLSRKWFGTSTVAKDVELQDAGALEFAADQASVARTDVTLSGNGTVVKTGDASLYYRSETVIPERAAGFNGAIDVKAGAVDLSTRLPVSLAAGGNVATTLSDEGALRVTVADGDANALVKSGTGTVAVAGIAAGVEKVNVTCGTLEISPAKRSADSEEEDDEVFIENPSFEDFKSDSDAADAKYYGLVDKAPYYKGWRRTGNSAWAFNWPNAGSTIRNSYRQTYAPLDGDCALMFHQNSSLFTPIKIAKAGTYEISFDCTSVDDNAHLGHYLEVFIVDESKNNATVASFGRAYCYESTYRHVALRAEVESTGTTFALRFHCDDYKGGAMVLDNVKLRRVHDCEAGRWDVPNGDFEVVGEPLFSSTNKIPVVESPYANWTFDQGQGRVALVTMATTNTAGVAGVECCNARKRADDFRQLLMSQNACSATVSCTPPAGTYYLRTDLARYYQYRGRLTATVKVGDAGEVELGSTEVRNSLMKTYTWPKAFAVSGSETVSIKFSFARSQIESSPTVGIWIDDVRLVTYDDREFLSDGGFSGGVNKDNWPVAVWQKLVGEGNGHAQVNPYSYLPDTFAKDWLEGSMFLYLERTGGAAQEVTLDHAGLYQLSFYTALSGRSYAPDGGWYRNSSPVRAWLADTAGVTNVIGNTGMFVNTNFSQYVWNFRVTKPGTYTFGIQGTSSNRGDCAMVDALSLRRIDESRFAASTSAAIPETTEVCVSAGAQLRLDFEGTNAIHKLRLGGELKHPGVYDASTDPDFISGTGALRIDSMDGALLIVR